MTSQTNTTEIFRNLNKEEHNSIIDFLKNNYPILTGADCTMYFKCIKSALLNQKDSRIYNKFKKWVELNTAVQS
jgi:hypothetical protein